MKTSTFSGLKCALNLYFAQKFLRKAKLLKVARTAKLLLKRSRSSTVGTGLVERA